MTIPKVNKSDKKSKKQSENQNAQEGNLSKIYKSKKYYLAQKKLTIEEAEKAINSLISIFTAFPEEERRHKAIAFRHRFRDNSWDECLKAAKFENIITLSQSSNAFIRKEYNTICCIRCKKELINVHALSAHCQSKHKERKPLLVSESYLSIVEEQSKRKNKEELKAALREQLAVDERPYYNVEAYQLAIRTMTTTEAYRLAKDETRSRAFLASHNSPVVHVSTTAEKSTQSVTGASIAMPERDYKEDVVFTSRTVKTRLNQAGFKARVANNFGLVCCVTGSGMALQAAHIIAVKNGGSNDTSNGLLLCSDLHWMFDNGYMAINPADMSVHFSKDCTWFGKGMFEGKRLAVSAVALNVEGLAKVWKGFQE